VTSSPRAIRLTGMPAGNESSLSRSILAPNRVPIFAPSGADPSPSLPMMLPLKLMKLGRIADPTGSPLNESIRIQDTGRNSGLAIVCRPGRRIMGRMKPVGVSTCSADSRLESAYPRSTYFAIGRRWYRRALIPKRPRIAKLLTVGSGTASILPKRPSSP
jgi:hypothetical protein